MVHVFGFIFGFIFERKVGIVLRTIGCGVDVFEVDVEEEVVGMEFKSEIVPMFIRIVVDHSFTNGGGGLSI